MVSSPSFSTDWFAAAAAASLRLFSGFSHLRMFDGPWLLLRPLKVPNCRLFDCTRWFNSTQPPLPPCRWIKHVTGDTNHLLWADTLKDKSTASHHNSFTFVSKIKFIAMLLLKLLKLCNHFPHKIFYHYYYYLERSNELKNICSTNKWPFVSVSCGICHAVITLTHKHRKKRKWHQIFVLKIHLHFLKISLFKQTFLIALWTHCETRQTRYSVHFSSCRQR